MTDDGTGLLFWQLDAEGARTEYAYDSHGRLTEQRFAGGTWEEYEHDPKGNVIRFTYADGNVIVLDHALAPRKDVDYAAFGGMSHKIRRRGG